MFSAGGTSADEPDPQETNPIAAAATAMILTIFIILVLYGLCCQKEDLLFPLSEQNTHLAGGGKY